MAKLTDEMKRLVAEQRLGFFATVCPDGTPNVSPKGTIAVYETGASEEDVRAAWSRHWTTVYGRWPPSGPGIRDNSW